MTAGAKQSARVASGHADAAKRAGEERLHPGILVALLDDIDRVPTAWRTCSLTITGVHTICATSMQTPISTWSMQPCSRSLSDFVSQSSRHWTANTSASFDHVTFRRCSSCLRRCEKSLQVHTARHAVVAFDIRQGGKPGGVCYAGLPVRVAR